MWAAPHPLIGIIRDLSPDRNRKIRILHCTSALTFGGELSILRRTIPLLDEVKFENLVCGIKSRDEDVGEFADLGVPVHALGARSRINVFRGAFSLARLVKRVKADVIHTQIFGNEREAYLAGMLTGVPVLGSLSTTFDPRLQAGGSRSLEMRIRATQALSSILARVSRSRFIAPNEWVAESARRFLHIADMRISVVPWGVDEMNPWAKPTSSQARDALRSELGIVEAHPVLLTVGRLVRVKGHMDLLQSMRYLVDRLPSVKLLIAGDGELADDLAVQVNRLGLSNHVKLLGRRDDIEDLLRLSDIFVFTSHYEGLPHSVLEAMAAAKPIVSFDIPPVAEILKPTNSGLLVGSRDPELFARAIADLFGDPTEASAMGKRALDAVRDRFDARKNIHLLERVYERLVPANHSVAESA